MQDDATTRQPASSGEPPTPGDGEAHRLSAGKRMGSICLIRQIGRGGMGEVWLGRHELLRRDVAVKFLLTGMVGHDNPAFTLFIEGARVAASIVHPGLNQVYHADVAEGMPYLVLELLEGENLAEVLEHSRRLQLANARAIIEAVCEAVAELHHRDLVHRDLKPSNFVLTTDGRIVVTDFGLACVRPAAALAGKTADVAGTPAYMAPEMFEGIISARTDVYAIGMSAYHLLCGRPAFHGGLDELRQQHRAVAADIAPLRAGGVPDEVIDVVVRATTKDALFRPKTARHLLDAFRAAFDARGIQCASRHALAGVLKEGVTAPDLIGPRRQARARPGYEALTALTLRRRDRRGPRGPHVSISSEPGEKVYPADEPRRRAERRRMRIVGIIASLLGTCAGVVLLRYVIRFTPVWNQWVNRTLVHARTVSSTPASGTTVFRSTPIWAQFLISAPPFAILAISCVGVSLFLYHRLRGERLAEVAGCTRCGWCQHELRGISRPVCSECGHRIGDEGPDENGLMPLVMQRGYRLRVLMLLPAIFLMATAVIAAIAGMILQFVVRGASGSINLWIVLFPVVFLALQTTMACYEGAAQYALTHCGRSWCRTCNGELRNLSEPICPACGTRI